MRSPGRNKILGKTKLQRNRKQIESFRSNQNNMKRQSFWRKRVLKKAQPFSTKKWLKIKKLDSGSQKTKIRTLLSKNLLQKMIFMKNTKIRYWIHQHPTLLMKNQQLMKKRIKKREKKNPSNKDSLTIQTRIMTLNLLQKNCLKWQ